MVSVFIYLLKAQKPVSWLGYSYESKSFGSCEHVSILSLAQDEGA